MTQECHSIYDALARQMAKVRHDFLYRYGQEPKIRFFIGGDTYYELMREDEMRFCKWGAVQSALKQSCEIEFHGFRGEIVDDLDGFLIQIMNLPK